MSHPHKPHFLLVDDQPSNLLVVKLILENFDYTFDEAEDGVEAVKLFYPGKYTAILMDIEMPNMNGYDACKKIRIFEDEKKTIYTPIIILTANDIVDVQIKTNKLSISNILNKPFTNAQLYKYLKPLIK